MTVHRSAQLIALTLVSISLLCAGCSRAGTSASGSESAPPVAPSQPRTTAPRIVQPTLEPTTPPTAQSSPAESPGAEPPMAEPPAASIAVEGGDQVVGQLGTFTWQDGGSDAPWLDGTPIHVGAGERVTMTLAEPLLIGEWNVSRVPPGNRDGIGAVAMQAGSGWPVTFGPPPSGQWSVEIRLRFADGVGSASYFWQIEVD